MEQIENCAGIQIRILRKLDISGIEKEKNIIDRLIKLLPLFGVYCPICKFTNGISTPEICSICRKEAPNDNSLMPVEFKPKEENDDWRR